ncbi:MAG: nucleotidyltransferase family protein [Nanoarchaeota archaeon]|nr:nucleotidyltransferase family protein [Nanoarchaeota archaeon]MBU4086414.1 nucleotidyltransferase family protein [Nanoarchaeota archaeon]
MNKNEEIEAIKLKIMPILKEYKVTKAGIFGSYARGEQKKKSDVDILIKIGDDAGFLTLAGLKLDLQKVINKKVDLVEYENIRKEIRDNILNDEICILQ